MDSSAGWAETDHRDGGRKCVRHFRAWRRYSRHGSDYGGKQDKSAAVEAVLSADGWQCDEAGEYPYYCNIPAPGITAADRAEITLAPESLLTSVECGLCPTCETLAGAIRLRAALAPERELKVEYWMTQGKE